MVVPGFTAEGGDEPLQMRPSGCEPTCERSGPGFGDKFSRPLAWQAVQASSPSTAPDNPGA